MASGNSHGGEGLVSRRRRIVAEFLQSAKDLTEDGSTEFYNFKHILNQLSQAEFETSLAEIIDGGDFDTGLHAAPILMHLNPRNPSSLKFLKDSLADRDPMKRFGAASVLATCEAIPTELIDSLSPMLGDENLLCRVSAAAASAGCSPKAVPILWRALCGYDESPLVEKTVWAMSPEGTGLGRGELEARKSGLVGMLKSLAATALGRTGLNTDEAMRVLVKGLKDGTRQEKLEKVLLLIRVGPHAEGALPALVNLLIDPDTDDDLRRAVASAIGKIGRSAEAATSLVKPLVRAMKGCHWSVADNIVSSLVAIGESPKAAVTLMVRQLDHADPTARGMAAVSLGKLGSRADAVVPALLDRARVESNRDVWLSIEDALVSIGPPALPHLLAIIRNDDLRLMPLAGGALARIGAAAAEQVAGMLFDADGRVRRSASTVLLAMGPKAAPAVPFAIRLLESRDEDTRLDAIIALSGLGPDAAEAAPHLARALSDPCPDIAEWASKALQQIGPGATGALEAAIPDADAAGRERIAALLARLGPSGTGQAACTDYGWIADDRLIECFVLIGGILETREPVAKRELPREIGRLQSQGMVSMDFPNRESTLRGWIRKLEAKLEERADPPVRLIGTVSTRPGGLTEQGRFYLQEFRRYLKAFGNK